MVGMAESFFCISAFGQSGEPIMKWSAAPRLSLWGRGYGLYGS